MPAAGNLPRNPAPAEWYFWGLLEFRSFVRDAAVSENLEIMS